MRIVHFGKFYSPVPGGIESVTQSLANGAALLGHNVQVVCFHKQNKAQIEELKGVTVHRIPILFMFASQPLSLRYILNCLHIGIRSDIVHLHAPNMLAALAGILLPKKNRLVLHWHSDVLNKGILGYILRGLEYLLLRRADAIIATSTHYIEGSAQLKSMAEKVRTIPIGVPDPCNSERTQRDLDVLLPVLPANKKIVLAVGRLVPYKGFEVLIKAAHYLDDCAVVIVGGGPLMLYLTRQIQEMAVGNRVILTGRISDELLSALFSKAHIFCLPSVTKAEAFGVVLLEAMAYSLPIVTTAIPGSGVPWVNAHGISGFNVTPNDPEALAGACNRILSSPSTRDRLACGARIRFESEFKEELLVRRILSLYQEMMD